MAVTFSTIKSLATCPIDWLAISGKGPSEIPSLYYEWAFIYNCAGFSETDKLFVSEVVQEAVGTSIFLDNYRSESAAEHKHLSDLLTQRIPEVRRRYEEGIGRLSSLTFLSSRDYSRGKHSPGGMSGDELASATAGKNCSRFSFELQSTDLYDLFWHCFENVFDPSHLDCKALWPEMSYESDDPEVQIDQQATGMWKNLRAAGNLRIAVNALTEIGASEGIPTTYVAIEISLSAKTIHAFPVTRAKAEQINGTDRLFSTDVLQGIL